MNYVYSKILQTHSKISKLQSIWFIGLMMMIGGLAFVATLSFEIPFAKLEAMLIGGKYFWIDNLFYWHKILQIYL